jgi:hypothetical protein
MFYYLLYNSSFSFIIDNRLFATILYGSILYILTHAILNYCNIEILSIINNYFWIIFILDVISLIYGIYISYTSLNILDTETEHYTNNDNNLHVSFNLLKNKINTLLDRKNDLTITQPITLPITHNTPTTLTKKDNTSNYSTPISKLPISQTNLHTHNNLNNNLHNRTHPKSNNQQHSTPINLIRTQLNNKDAEPIIDEYLDNNIYGNNFDNKQNDKENNKQNNKHNNKLNDTQNDNNNNESVAGSDIGNMIDLEDFEKSL